MRQKFTYNFSWIILIAFAVSMNFAFAGGTRSQKTDTTIHFLKKSAKTSYFKNGLHLALPPLKPAVTSAQKVSVVRPDDKLLTDVQVFPNPVTDQVNGKFVLSHSALVTVKIMDVLGNEVATILSQHVSSGDQTFSYLLGGKLQHGFYFVRIVAGTESVIKRISVL